MINEHQEENACLYVAGALSPQENRAFENELRANLELQAFVKQLQDAASALAVAETPLAPPPQLKDKILAQIDLKTAKAEPKIKAAVSFSPATATVKWFQSLWLPWAVAAGFALFAGSQFFQAQSLRRQSDSLDKAIAGLSMQVVDLKKQDNFSQVRISLLNSLLANSPKTVAVSVWNNEKQNGVLVVEGLAPAPSNKDYQLWVINDKYPAPVSAGVFSVDEQGKVRFTFKPDMPMTSVDKFAVTVERKGGVQKPEGKMVLLGI